MIDFSLQIQFEPKTAPTVDQTPPTPGNSGTLSTSSVTYNSYSVDFTQATDNESNQSALKYYLYISTSNNLGSDVATAINNGTLKSQGTAVSSLSATGLSQETQYWHQIIAEDENGNKAAYNGGSVTTVTPATTGPDSRAGDEAALEALAGSLSGLGTGWATSGMSLSNSIDGVTVDTIGGELRVTEIDLRNRGLTGNIAVPEFENLKQMTLFAIYGNNLVSTIPRELVSLPNLEYLYLCMENAYVGDSNQDLYVYWPHEITSVGGGDVHTGKTGSNEGNHYTGTIPAPVNPSASKLKWLIVNWTDSGYGIGDGISAVEPGLFDVTTYECLYIYNNYDIALLDFPTGIGNMTNLTHLALGAEKPSDGQGFLTGTVPANFGNLPNLKFLRLNENANLDVNFDNLDLSGWSSMRNMTFTSCSLRGTFPTAVTDGSMPELVGFNLGWPKNSNGMTGTFTSGVTTLQIAIVINNDLSGTIPANFWNNTSIINTDFSYNNFTSIGTDDLTRLGENYWGIRNLRWAYNQVSGRWPNLAWGTSQLDGFLRFEVQGNKYVFSDMLWIPSSYNPSGLTIFELYSNHGLTSFTYSNQVFGQPGFYDLAVGDNVTINNFDTVVTHPDNSYQWQRNGANISGATSRSLTLPNVQLSDEGIYTLTVTNPGVSGLTIVSEDITINVS